MAVHWHVGANKMQVRPQTCQSKSRVQYVHNRSQALHSERAALDLPCGRSFTWLRENKQTLAFYLTGAASTCINPSNCVGFKRPCISPTNRKHIARTQDFSNKGNKVVVQTEPQLFLALYGPRKHGYPIIRHIISVCVCVKGVVNGR